MVDYRISLVQYIKSILGSDYPVFDGAMSYLQPQNNYISYFIVNEEGHSWKNSEAPVYNSVTNKFEQDHNPLKKVSISLDIRGDNSFFDSRRLYDSFFEYTNIQYMKSLGIGFMTADGISSIPHLKDSYNEEGYQFVIHITYDARYVTDVDVIEKVNLLKPYMNNCGVDTNKPITTDCNLSIGGSTGTEWNEAGLWIDNCPMFVD
ncbi:MAG: phage neck terminator protein [Candidatus Thorarchaeota archaeon]